MLLVQIYILKPFWSHDFLRIQYLQGGVVDCTNFIAATLVGRPLNFLLVSRHIWETHHVEIDFEMLCSEIAVLHWQSYHIVRHLPL